MTDILSTYLHFRDDGRVTAMPGADAFWEQLAAGGFPELEAGRLMSAFTFSEDWPNWERHPAGDELVLLLSGAATLVLEEAAGEREVTLSSPGDFVLVPRNTWHTARTSTTTTMLFLTPGAGTEHRDAT